MDKRKLCFFRVLLLCLFLSIHSFSQAALSFANVKQSRGDSIRMRFVQPIKTRFEIQGNYGSRNSLLVLTSRGKSPAVINYANQNPTQIGVVISFFNLSLPVSFSPSFLSNGFGLRNFSFSPSSYGKWLWWNADFNYSKGYGISSFKDLSQAYLLRETDFKTIRNDLRSWSLSTSLTLVPNSNRYSSAAVFSFTSRQLHSAGSLLMGVNTHFGAVSSDSSLIPVDARGAFSAEQDFVKSRTVSVGLAFGYTYTLVLGKDLFANITLLPSLATSVGTTTDESGKELRHVKVLTPSNTFGYAAFGHNGQRCYWGASLRGHTYKESPRGANLLMSYVTPSVFVGFRVVKWNRSVVPPKLKNSAPSKFKRGQAVSWWSGGTKHSGVVVEIYRKGFYKVRETATKEEVVWEEKDLMLE